MLSTIQESLSKMITMKKKEDFRTLFIISLTWISLYLNWNYVFNIENKSKNRRNDFKQSLLTCINFNYIYLLTRF